MTICDDTARAASELIPLDTPVDQSVLRGLYGQFPSGVVAVCGLLDGEPVGLAASSFSAVSLDPPLVAVCAQTTSSTWPRLRMIPALGISILQQDQAHACVTLSKRGVDRFADVAWAADDTGAVFLGGATAWMRCGIVNEFAAGDHEVVLFEVRAFRAFDDSPLVFQGSRFRSLATEPDSEERRRAHDD